MRFTAVLQPLPRKAEKVRTHESSNFRIDLAGICLPVKQALAHNKFGPLVELLLLLLPARDRLLVGDAGDGRVHRLGLLVPRTQQQKRTEMGVKSSNPDRTDTLSRATFWW